MICYPCHPVFGCDISDILCQSYLELLANLSGAYEWISVCSMLTIFWQCIAVKNESECLYHFLSFEYIIVPWETVGWSISLFLSDYFVFLWMSFWYTGQNFNLIVTYQYQTFLSLKKNFEWGFFKPLLPMIAFIIYDTRVFKTLKKRSSG